MASQPTTTPPLRVYLILIGGLLSIGFSGIFVSWAKAPGAVTGFYRMGIAVLILFLPFLQQYRRERPFPVQAVKWALLAGIFFGIDLIFWNSGILLSGAANPTLMSNTAPLWVGLGAFFFFKERPPVWFWWGLLLAMMGAMVILGVDALNDVGLGTLFGLLAGIFYGAYFLVMQRVRQQMSALTSFWLATVSATIILAFGSLLLDQPLTGYSTNTYLNFLALGVVVQVMGQLALNYALGYLPASIVAPSALGQPVLTAVLAVPLLGQPLRFWQIIGGILVLTGVFIVHRSRRHQP